MCQFCDEEFLARVKQKWEFEQRIDSAKIPRLIAIAEKCQSQSRIEDENKWLRERIDRLVTTTTLAKSTDKPN